MFLRCTRRVKDGKAHEYWNLVENRRLADAQNLDGSSSPACLGLPGRVVKTYGLGLNQIKHLAVLPGAS